MTGNTLKLAKDLAEEKEKISQNITLFPNKDLFKNSAPLLWQKGLPVIPLRPRGKEPIPINWTSYKDKMPLPQEQDHWLNNFPDSNIGLPLGPQSGCVAIDIDTENKTLINIINEICGYSPWERVGQKGKFSFINIKERNRLKLKT